MSERKRGTNGRKWTTVSVSKEDHELLTALVAKAPKGTSKKEILSQAVHQFAQTQESPTFHR